MVVERIDEFGNTLARSKFHFDNIIALIKEASKNKSEYPLAYYIDPYGNTYFNRLQIPDLLNEIKKIALEINISVDELIAFIERTGIHEYIIFEGD